MRKIADRQQGVSLSGLLIWLGVLIFLAIAIMKVAPAYIQDQEIKSILSTIARDPEIQNAAAKDIRESFSKRAMMNNISIIDVNDIEINKHAGVLVLSVEYSMKIELFGNASLLLEFHPSSA